MDAEKKFSLEELSKFDGREGRPAYVACDGKVYDVTDAYLWAEGNHMGMHDAGKDLTQDLQASSHGDSVIENMKQVGILI